MLVLHRPLEYMPPLIYAAILLLCVRKHVGHIYVNPQQALPALQSDAALAEKAVDCLRILTTGNEHNQTALYGIPVGIRTLVNIISTNSPESVRP